MSRTSKGVLKFVGLLLVSATIGFLTSYYGMKGIQGLQGFQLEKLSVGLYPNDIVSFVLLLSVIGLLAASVIDYSRSKSIEDIDRSEKIFGKALMYNSFGMFVSILTFILIMLQMMGSNAEKDVVLPTFIAGAVLLVANMILQYVLLRHFNKCFPKRTVNLYSISEDGKPFIDKLDEAEKHIVFKSSYRAFSAQNKALSVLTFISFAYGALVEFQLYPFVILLVLYVVNNVSYYREASKHY